VWLKKKTENTIKVMDGKRRNSIVLYRVVKIINREHHKRDRQKTCEVGQWTRMCTIYVHFYAHDTVRTKINTTAKRDPDSPCEVENPGPFWPWY